MLTSVVLDEATLRQLAVELAKDIEAPEAILSSMGLTYEEYDYIKDTRAFKSMYNQALTEWSKVNNVQQRTKFKAAYSVERALPTFFSDMMNKDNSLSARTELLKTIARIGALGNPEPVLPATVGAQFKLEIHLQGRTDPIVVGSVVESEPDQLPLVEPLEQSALVTEEDYDEL